MIKNKVLFSSAMIGSSLLSAMSLSAISAKADSINNDQPSLNTQNENVVSSNTATSNSLKNESNNSSNTTNENDNNNISSDSLNNKDIKSTQDNNSSVNETNSNLSNNAISDNANTNNENTNISDSTSNNVINNNNLQENNNTNNQNASQPNRNNIAVSFAATNQNDPQSMTDPAHNQESHLNVSQGWSNDVQSIVKNKDGYYDVYFLATPDGKGASDNGIVIWKHTTTKDWKNFTQQNTAINVGKGGNNWIAAATGSVVINQGNITGVPKDAQVAYFAGFHDAQSIYAAWSDDNGKTFSHALNNGNPVIDWNSPGASQDKDNFRDADVSYYNGKLLMYTAEGGKFGVYSSDDGIHWSKADPNGDSKVLPSTFMKGMTFSNADIPVECPVLRTMKTSDGQTKTVLFYGGKNAENKQTTGTYYVVGHLDKNGLFVADYDAHRLDLGSDFYAANFDGSADLSQASDSLISLGWIGNWGYTGNGVYDNQDTHNSVDKSQETQHIGAYSTPRKLTLNNDGTINNCILQDISKSSNTITVSPDSPSNKDNKPYTVAENDGAQVNNLIDHTGDNASNVYDLDFKTKDGKPYQGRIYIDIWQGKDYVRFNYDPSNGWMQCNQYAAELDNDNSGMNASNCYKETKSANTGLSNKSDIDLKVITDKDSVEFFFPNGQVYTVERFATQDNQDFKVYTLDPNKDNQLVFSSGLSLQPVQFVADKPANNNQSNNNSNTTNTSKPTTNTNDNKQNSSSNNTTNTNKPNNQSNSNNQQDITKLPNEFNQDGAKLVATYPWDFNFNGKKINFNENGIQQLPDGSFIMSGNTQDPADKSNSRDQDLILSHLTKDFKPIDYMIISHGGHGSVVGALQNKDGSISIYEMINDRSQKDGNDRVVEFTYQPNKTLANNDSSIKVIGTPANSTIPYDGGATVSQDGKEIAFMPTDDIWGQANPKIYVYGLQDNKLSNKPIQVIDVNSVKPGVDKSKEVIQAYTFSNDGKKLFLTFGGASADPHDTSAMKNDPRDIVTVDISSGKATNNDLIDFANNKIYGLTGASDAEPEGITESIDGKGVYVCVGTWQKGINYDNSNATNTPGKVFFIPFKQADSTTISTPTNTDNKQDNSSKPDDSKSTTNTNNNNQSGNSSNTTTTKPSTNNSQSSSKPNDSKPTTNVDGNKQNDSSSNTTATEPSTNNNQSGSKPSSGNSSKPTTNVDGNKQNDSSSNTTTTKPSTNNNQSNNKPSNSLPEVGSVTDTPITKPNNSTSSNTNKDNSNNKLDENNDSNKVNNDNSSKTNTNNEVNKDNSSKTNSKDDAAGDVNAGNSSAINKDEVNNTKENQADNSNISSSKDTSSKDNSTTNLGTNINSTDNQDQSSLIDNQSRSSLIDNQSQNITNNNQSEDTTLVSDNSQSSSISNQEQNTLTNSQSKSSSSENNQIKDEAPRSTEEIIKTQSSNDTKQTINSNKSIINSSSQIGSSSNNDLPQTGDSKDEIALMALASLGLIGMTYRKRKED